MMVIRNCSLNSNSVSNWCMSWNTQSMNCRKIGEHSLVSKNA